MHSKILEDDLDLMKAKQEATQEKPKKLNTSAAKKTLKKKEEKKNEGEDVKEKFNKLDSKTIELSENII